MWLGVRILLLCPLAPSSFSDVLNKMYEYKFLVLEILHFVQNKFPDDVLGAAVGPIFNGHKLGPTAAPETSSGNLSCTTCKISKTKNQYSLHGESLKSRWMKIAVFALLGCYAFLVLSYRRFGTAYRSHFNGPVLLDPSR
jgi:hypothetical protein